MKTFIPKVDPSRKKWWLVDMQDAILGRAAVKVATVLRGKHTPLFTPHLDTGDHVVVVNASRMKISGANKPQQLAYYRYSGYPGGLNRVPYEKMIQTKPEEVFRLAVRRMLPKNRLGRKMFKKLHVYAGPNHPHKAQKPEAIKL